MGYGIVYKATNKVNGKVYIGQTIHTLENRASQHKHDAIKNKKNGHFQNAIIKYGFDAFIWEQIDTAENKEELNEKEKCLVDLYDSTNRDKGYNTRAGGDSGGTLSEETKQKLREANIGKKTSLETRKKISEVHKGRRHTEEAKAKMSRATKGKKRSPEARKKISEGHKGQIPWNKGKHGIYSAEQLQKMSESQKGEKSAWFGRKHTPEEIEKIVKGREGYRHSENTKRKIGEANRGKRHTAHGRKKAEIDTA
jgi:group I intron endonuclease